MVDGGIDHLRADVDAEHTNHKDSEAVPQQGKRDDGKAEHSPFPWCAEEVVAAHDAGNDQDQTGMDATAFGGNLKAEAGELKTGVVLGNRHAGEFEKEGGGDSRSVLEKINNAIFDTTRKWNHEGKKAKGECQHADILFSQEPKAGGKEKCKKRADGNGESICGRPPACGMEDKPVNREERRACQCGSNGKSARGLGMINQFVAFAPSQLDGDEWDQEDVGVKLAVKSKPRQVVKRQAEAKQQKRKSETEGFVFY